MRVVGLVAVLGTLLIALVAGVIGYNLGLGANVAATAGATVVYPAWGFGFGFPFFGLIFGILLFVLIFGLIRRAAWGGHPGYRRGMSGPGGWGPRRGWPAPPWTAGSRRSHPSRCPSTGSCGS